MGKKAGSCRIGGEEIAWFLGQNLAVGRCSSRGAKSQWSVRIVLAMPRIY